MFDNPEGRRRITLDLLSDKAIKRLIAIAAGEVETTSETEVATEEEPEETTTEGEDLSQEVEEETEQAEETSEE